MFLIFLFFLVGLTLFFMEGLAPGIGVFGITGIISFVIGIIYAYIFMPTYFMQIVFLEIVILILFIMGLLYFINKTGGLVKKLTLTETLNEDKSNDVPKDILGKVGICKTALKPVGVITIEDVDYEVLSKSKYQNIGDKVTVIAISSNKIFVDSFSENI